MEKEKLPDEWMIQSIEKCISNQLSGFACAMNKLVENEGYVQLRPFNIEDGKLNLDTLYQVPLDMVDERKYFLEKGDILFNNTNSTELVGKSTIADKDYPFAFSNHINRIRVNSNLILPEYFHSYLRFMWSREHFARHCKKWIGQSGYTLNKLKEQMILVPPLEIQREIVDKLDKQMTHIEVMKKEAEIQMEIAENLILTYLDALSQNCASSLTIFKEYMVKSRNGYGNRPNGLENGPIILRISDVSSGTIDYSNVRRGNVDKKTKNKYALMTGNLIFIRVNGSKRFIGKCIHFSKQNNEEVLFNDHLIKVEIKSQLLPKFIELWCKTPFIRRYMANSASTSAGQLTINRSVLENMPIPKIDCNSQNEILKNHNNLNFITDKLFEMIDCQFNAINQLPESILNEVFGKYELPDEV